MQDVPALFDGLAAIGLGGWRAALDATVEARLAATAHGHMPRWKAALASLPPAGAFAPQLDAAVVTVGPPAFEPAVASTVRAALLELAPWRKGPFRIGDILVDAEWRSDLKWARLADAVAPLTGRRILDVGCGNGYYMLRMRGAGAAAVIGLEPTLSHVAQFQAVRHWLPPEPLSILPLRLHELPPGGSFFDTVFSMGVLYHQRDPGAHLAQLRAALAPGGELVLETLVLPGDGDECREPAGRYARMRNVWHLPTVPRLMAWLGRAGFREPRLLDVSRTTVREQRRTAWMPFESLAEALAPDDAGRTVEGWPAPHRAIVLARQSTAS